MPEGGASDSSKVQDGESDADKTQTATPVSFDELGPTSGKETLYGSCEESEIKYCTSHLLS